MKKEEIITTDSSVYSSPEITSLDITVETGFAATGSLPGWDEEDW